MLNKIIEFLSGADSSVSRRDFLKGSAAVSVGAVVATNVDAKEYEAVSAVEKPLHRNDLSTSNKYGKGTVRVYHADTREHIGDLDLLEISAGRNYCTRKVIGRPVATRHPLGITATIEYAVDLNCPITMTVMNGSMAAYFEFYSSDNQAILEGFEGVMHSGAYTLDPEIEYMVGTLELEENR